MSDSEQSSAYDKNTKEQYECLGRFVEAFEAMVHEVRSNAIEMLAADTEFARLVEIPFYHAVMTAKPIFEIFRAIIATQINNGKFCAQHGIDGADQSAFHGVLAEIAKEYGDLSEIRNHMLHGTWFVGFLGGQDEEANEFEIHRLTVGKAGLKSAAEIPKNALELRHLIKRCEVTRHWISVIHGCMPKSLADLKMKDSFRHNGTDWECVWPSPSTLPAPPP